MGNELTYTEEEDGAIALKDAEGNAVRYVKESDLLAVKGSREGLERAARDAEAAHATNLKEANDKVEAEHQNTLKAEARVSSLEEQIASGSADVGELARLKQELEAAKEAEKGSATKLLELKRTHIVGAYGVPVATVENKSLPELETFEEALKAVMGQKGIGNYAAGGTGGGTNPLEGKHPMELAQMAYSQK